MKINFVYLHQDSPRKSTMKKLERMGMAKMIPAREAGRNLVLRGDAKTILKQVYVDLKEGMAPGEF